MYEPPRLRRSARKSTDASPPVHRSPAACCVLAMTEKPADRPRQPYTRIITPGPGGWWVRAMSELFTREEMVISDLLSKRASENPDKAYIEFCGKEFTF